MISAYGSDFKADPALNLKAYQKYIELNQGTGRHVIAIGGAGSLFTDESHTAYCYETPEHPDFLRGISKNIKLGIDEIKEAADVNWTSVCPSSFFDPEGMGISMEKKLKKQRYSMCGYCFIKKLIRLRFMMSSI